MRYLVGAILIAIGLALFGHVGSSQDANTTPVAEAPPAPAVEKPTPQVPREQDWDNWEARQADIDKKKTVRRDGSAGYWWDSKGFIRDFTPAEWEAIQSDSPMPDNQPPRRRPVKASPPAPERILWRVDDEQYEQALSEAKRLHRHVFIDYAPAWCKVCQGLKTSLYGQPAVRDRLELKMVPLCIGQGSVSAKYGLSSAPWVLIVDGDGNKVASYQPMHQPTAFLQQLDSKVDALNAPEGK